MQEWLRTWSPLSLGVLLMVVAVVALVRERMEAAWMFGGLGSMLLGVWITVLLHDRFSSKDDHGGNRDG
jgi:hypothetical protein